MSRNKIPPDPKLELIRDEGLKGPLVDYDIKELLQRTRRIHAGWLFDRNNMTLLQKVCRLLDGNLDTYNTPGWGRFGHELGLSSEILNVIEYSKLGPEGYTFYVLQHYVQKHNATINKIIDTLNSIKRLDVINETHSYFSKLADHAVNSANQENSIRENNHDSGFSSQSMDDLSAESEQENHNDNNSVNGSIIRPKDIPTPALVLQDSQEISYPTIVFSAKIEQENFQNSEPPRTPINPVKITNSCRENRKTKQNYDCVVMLTFANDGIKFAKEVASVLRAKADDGQQIGVLVLEEQREKVEKNPELFINGVFPQVNFVVPIITEGYLNAVLDVNRPNSSEFSYLDCKYVRYIYTLMVKNYVDKGCLNRKVRCIIPDSMLDLNRQYQMRHPIFETWVELSNTHKLAKRMLDRCMCKKFNH